MNLEFLPRNTENIVSFWRAKGLSIRASNCLAKASILNEEMLVTKMTTFEEVLALRNCGRLTAEEIWTFIMNLKLDIPPKASLSYENLSDRAKRVLARLCITNDQQLIETMPLPAFTRDEILALPGVGVKTCNEIWKLLQYLRSNQATLQGEEEAKTLSPYTNETNQVGQVETPIFEASQDYLFSLYAPLLGIEISEEIWEALQNIPVHRVTWSFRSLMRIRRQGCQTLADVAKIRPNEWLKLRNFGQISLAELQQKITEIINNKTSFDKNEEVEVQSVSIHEVPLLGMEVSEEIWEVLRNTPIHRFTWNVRTEKGIHHQGCQTLADVAKIRPNEWLKLKNLGRTSFAELRDRIIEVINSPEIFNTISDNADEVSTSQVDSLLALGNLILESLKKRQQEVVKHYYGFEDTFQNLQQVGTAIGITRERVRQIKDTVNAKISQGEECHFITTEIVNLLGELITEHLTCNNGFCSVEELQQVISQKLGWGKTEQWIINWFDEAFGKKWICLGADDYEVVDGICYLKSAERSGHEFFAGLVKKLQSYGYHPLTLDECFQLYNDTNNQPFDSKQFLNFIVNHPELKIYEYGATYIGLREWEWFNPPHRVVSSAKEQADFAEWYLRRTNEPATAEAIANGICTNLGNFRLTPFEVADACESNPHRFKVDENDYYSLYIWEYASKYKQQVLEMLLEHETLHVEQIVNQLSPDSPDEASFIVAALNRYKDTFVEITPFEWSLKDVDYTKLGFGELIPK